MIKKILSLLIITSLAFVACKKDTRTLNQIQDGEIQAFLKSRNLTGFQKDSSGYYYKVINEGTGSALTYPDYIYYLQTLKDLNGAILKIQGNQTPTIENSSYLANYLGYVSPTGFRENIIKLHKGGTIRAIIPSYLAFGKDGFGSQVKGNTIIDATFTVPNVDNRFSLADSLITAYKATIPLSFTRDSTGIYYSIINQGTGTDTVTVNSTIKVAYTGKLFDGTVFDSATAAKPLESPLYGLISGWQNAIPKIRSGGKIRLLIPSYLGYGSTASGAIPPNAPLDFEIDLLGVTN
ncbi:MAG: FKBP-type peptidyl-prolyl cis-trans isomerase [Sphingobacteriales bacterium]|nr:FKBP-type peptidyl-prolyl cis-trans isomerase [Sphingobacteriales bacterium]